MKEIDQYNKWVEWSDEDQTYIGKCPDLITGIHGDDPVKLYAKAALFFFAFLPQFVDAKRGSAATQIMFLGAIVVVLGALSDSTYALLSGSVGNLLRGNLRLLRAQRYFAGSVYIGLGAMTALTGSSKKG